MTHHQLDDHQMVMIYNQLVPYQGFSSEEGKRSRRRKKNTGETSNGGVVRKRKLSEEQVNLLEWSFEDTHKLGSERKAKLASELDLDPQQVAVWFQNRRARWKNKKLEDEYYKLKSHHEIAIVEKCRLETQIVKIKEQLFEAQKEIQRLSLEHNCPGVSNNNNTLHQISMDQLHFLGEFGMEEILMESFDAQVISHQLIEFEEGSRPNTICTKTLI